MSVTADHKLLKALLEVHKTDSDVLISNGFLKRVEDSSELIESLNDEEKAFFEDSVAEFDRFNMLQYEANQESVNALAQAEQKAKELAVANGRAERAKQEAQAARQEAERLAQRETLRRSEIEQELESTQQYQMQSDRQRRQFITAQAHGYPAWALLYVMVVGIMVLMWFDKGGVDVLVPVLAGVLGALYQAYSGSFSSLFTPLMREEQKPKNGKKPNDKEL